MDATTMSRTMNGMATPAYDLWYDATTVGADLVVLCWISHGPRRDDPGFDPQPGDYVRVGDDDETSLRARIIRRDGDRVAVQVELSGVADPVA
jgi:hypothetical protein